MRVLTVVNVVDASIISPPIFPFQTPTLALAVVKSYPPLAAIETLSSPSMITLNIPNRSAGALLSHILSAHRGGKTRRNNSSPRLSPKSPPVPTAFTALGGDKHKGKADKDNFFGFNMMTGAMETRRINLSHSDGSESDDSTEQGSTNSSAFSSPTLVDDNSLEGHYFHIHEFTTVTKLIAANHAMHRSSFFVPPRRDRRRPSYDIKRLHRMTGKNDQTTASNLVFNFGFDADPNLDEDFGVLTRQRQVEEVRALAHACAVADTERMKYGAWETKLMQPRPPTQVKRIPRVPVPRYEDLDGLDTKSTSCDNDVAIAPISTPTAQSELKEGTNGSSSVTEQQILDLLWGNGPIDLAHYWSSRRRID